jgi:amino acid transporter
MTKGCRAIIIIIIIIIGIIAWFDVHFSDAKFYHTHQSNAEVSNMWGLGQRSNFAFIIADIIYC